jgi:hypothetical protein
MKTETPVQTQISRLERLRDIFRHQKNLADPEFQQCAEEIDHMIAERRPPEGSGKG